MPKFKVFYLSAILSLLFSIFTLHPAMASQMVRAYVLLETPASLEAVQSSAGSFSNCKPLFNRIFTGEFVVHVHCNDIEDLNKAITDNLYKAEGVSGITILRIVKIGNEEVVSQ